MEQVRLIYEQIEEAKKYLLGGSLLQLRLALILLDNSAELMMHQELQSEFAKYDAWEPKCEPARTEWINAGLGPKYTEEERRDSQKEFEPKVRILHLRLHRISESDRAVLGVCHRLRCEAFHRGHLRAEILGQVCRLLYLRVADLTLKLPFKAFFIPASSDKESADFFARFGVEDAYSLSTEGARFQMKNKLVEGIEFEPGTFAHTLSDDLADRLDRVVDGLAYVVEDEDSSKIDRRLQYSQFWQDLGARLFDSGVRGPAIDEEFDSWKAPGRARFTWAKIQQWRRRSAAIRHRTNPASALDHYWAIDKRFSPLEQDVAEAVYRFDEQINMEVHARRR